MKLLNCVYDLMTEKCCENQLPWDYFTKNSHQNTLLLHGGAFYCSKVLKSNYYGQPKHSTISIDADLAAVCQG